MRHAALICLLLMTCAAMAHKGDGRLLDRGASAAHNRFELDLGPVDLERAEKREFRFSGLPKEEFTFGLRLRAPAGERLSHLPGATVRMTLVNEKDQVVFTIDDALSNWIRSESSGEWFLYSRGAQRVVPLEQGRTKVEQIGVGPDGGWGTYVVARPDGHYRLVVETVKPDVRLSKFEVRLIAVGGGWK